MSLLILKAKDTVQEIGEFVGVYCRKWFECLQVHMLQGVFQICACCVVNVSVFMQLLRQLQLVIVHEILIDYNQQWFPGTQSLQAAASTSMTDDQVCMLDILSD